jgi:hypothetical protein
MTTSTSHIDHLLESLEHSTLTTSTSTSDKSCDVVATGMTPIRDACRSPLCVTPSNPPLLLPRRWGTLVKVPSGIMETPRSGGKRPSACRRRSSSSSPCAAASAASSSATSSRSRRDEPRGAQRPAKNTPQRPQFARLFLYATPSQPVSPHTPERRPRRRDSGPRLIARQPSGRPSRRGRGSNTGPSSDCGDALIDEQRRRGTSRRLRSLSVRYLRIRRCPPDGSETASRRRRKRSRESAGPRP